MNIVPQTIQGVYLIENHCHQDERGSFVQCWQKDRFIQEGMKGDITFSAISQNKKMGTLRGLHYQIYPHAQSKYISCLKGAIYDVVCDLRIDSETYGKWQAFELDAWGNTCLYIPDGCAHGFQSLADDTEVHYQIHGDYEPGLERGIHWQCPTLKISWPIPKAIVSQKDNLWQPFNDNRVYPCIA